MRGNSTLVVRPAPQGEGGSIPTLPLQLRKRDWWIAGCDQDIARSFVEENHYAAGTSNTYTYLHGLYPVNWLWYSEFAGVAWWIPPTMTAAKAWHPDNPNGVLCLSRLCIAPGVPSNACSFLLSKSVMQIDRRRWPVLVTYADSWRGHTGTIYRAAGWEYCGETKPEPTYTLRGRMLARKRGDKTRTHAEMMALGCEYHGRHSKSRFRLVPPPEKLR